VFFDSKPKWWSVSPEFNELSGQYRRNIQQGIILWLPEWLKARIILIKGI